MPSSPNTIYRRPGSGIYYATIGQAGVLTKLNYRSLRTRDRQEALRRLSALLHPVAPAPPTPQPGELTLGDINARLTVFCSDLSPNTIKHVYTPAIRTFLSCCGNKALTAYTVADIETWKAYLAANYSPTSCSIYLKHTRALFNRFQRAGYVADNVLKKVAGFRVPRVAVAYMTVAQATEFLKCVEHPTLRGLFFFLLSTGCRIGEAVALRWIDLDLESRTASIPVTKTGRSRTVPLSLPLRDYLTGLEHVSDYVFSLRGGLPVDRTTATHAFKAGAKAAGMPTLKLHSTRHSFGSNLIRGGVNLVTVSRILGHQSIRITSEFYSHLEPAQYRDAVDSLGLRL